MMFKTRKLALAGLALFCCASFAQDIRGSIVTVDELLKLDNEQALRNAKEDAIKSGLIAPPANPGARTKQGVSQARWVVKSVFGSARDLKADLFVDGTPVYSATSGLVVGSCKLVEVIGSCVVVVPASPKIPKGACPSRACWTGDELSAELQPSQGGGAPTTSEFKLQKAPLPTSPIPLPVGSVAPEGLGKPSK